MHPGRIAAGNNLAGDVPQIVVQRDDMIAVPTHAPADMQKDLRQIEEHTRDLISDRLGGMVVARIEAEQFLSGDAVAEVEFSRSHSATLGPDAEELRLHGVEIVLGWQRLFEDFIERIGQPLARRLPIGGRVFEAIRHPDIRHAGAAERLAKGGADLARSPAMLDPKLPDPLVGMGERETAGRFCVGKAGGIEIEPHSPLLRPLDPGLEVGRFNLVAINLLPGKLAVEGMQVEPVAARDEREGHVEIGPQFIRRAGLARIVARHCQPAAEFLAGMLKAANVVPLPAVERNGNLGEAAQRLLHAHAVGRVEFLGQFECGRHLLCCVCHGRILPARIERGNNAP